MDVDEPNVAEMGSKKVPPKRRKLSQQKLKTGGGDGAACQSVGGRVHSASSAGEVASFVVTEFLGIS